jgi:hypothetical protein
MRPHHDTFSKAIRETARSTGRGNATSTGAESRASALSSGDPAEFATFWHGPLNPTVYGCLASFAAVGARLRVYSYDARVEAPSGAEVWDARRICPDESLVHRFLVGGSPSLAAFADMFRYRMIRETGCCWVDSDTICLRKPDFRADAIVFGRQPEASGAALINNAVMKLPRAHKVLDALICRTEEVVDVDQAWGATGPFLLTEIAEKLGIGGLARGSGEFYPIGPDDFWKPLSPTWRSEVLALTRPATFLHLWSELLRRAGHDFYAGPPVGSFLHGIFARLGVLRRFGRV